MRGRIVFNGNIGGALIERVAPWILGAAGGRPPRVLLVTAAWGAGEYNEGPIKDALNAIGVPSAHVGGYDRNIVNLCAWHALADLLRRRPDVAATWNEIEAAEGALRGFYLERTAFHADLVRRGIATAKAWSPGFALGGVGRLDPVRPDAVHTADELVLGAMGRELDASIRALVDNDERMLAALTQADEQVLTRTGLRLDPEWRAARARLEERLVEADVILLFGGSPEKLLTPFRFFELKPALLETVRRGATVVATSAGALVLCERIIVYDQHASDPQRRDFRLLDRGLGLVGGVQVLPHCMDRIQTDDPDNLAYLARRFSTRLCVGLNRESFLELDLAGPVATSVGAHDGVYVFGPDGVKTRYDRGERVPLVAAVG
ncbi:MAG TPA: Type 1 glutamine amidotransferase-like domain-containing protein [Myxococcota bacterium]|nr:Type 1 glutamine amidotransferase-like domain-containing protein [Myxococcota bacterium]